LGKKVLIADPGLDHGVDVPLFHRWPKADVPILQFSMPKFASEEELFALGQRLAPLRDETNALRGHAG